MSKRINARPFSPCALRTVLASVLLAALTFAVLPTPVAQAGGSSHPYFNDNGTLRWYTRYADAIRAAKQQNKLVLIEAGRKRCSMCKRLCTTVLPDRAIRGRIARIAVGLVGNADQPEPAIQSVMYGRFADARMLPIVWFIAPDGTYVAGFWGKRTVQQFARDLDIAEAAWRKLRQSRPANPGAVALRIPVRAAPPVRPTAPVRIVAPAAPGCGGQVAALGGDECCVGDNCGVPKGLREAYADAALPKAPARIEASADLPAPAAQVGTDNGPAPRGDAVRAAGGPDGVAAALPAPVVRPPATIKPRPLTGVIRPAARGSSTLMRAQQAAAREQWGRVLSTIGNNATTDPKLLRLARQAHQWAHDQLELAVRHMQASRAAEARAIVRTVRAEMVGQPEAEDARRGLTAIESLEDLNYLAKSSRVRRAVQRNAYERMRGSRWAKVFQDTK